MKASAADRLDELGRIAKDLRRLGDVAESLCIAEQICRGSTAEARAIVPPGFTCPACHGHGAVATRERYGTRTFYCLDCEHGWDERKRS